MKLENSIGWCDATINAVNGCEKVSLGCKNCYAESGTFTRVLRERGIISQQGRLSDNAWSFKEFPRHGAAAQCGLVAAGRGNHE